MGKIKFMIKKLIPDKIYLKILYKKILNKKLNLKTPQTFNEKMQWLKLYNRNPLYTTLVDKYEVKQYISDKIGENYIIPTIGIYNKFNEINFDELPDKFVMKCTHDSGSTIICTSKKKFDVEAAKKKIEKCMSINYYYNGREWPYKNVKPRIIIEKYINISEKEEMIDYKFFCFNGIPKMLLVCTERSEGLKKTFFDMNGNIIKLKEGNHENNYFINLPTKFAKMKELAQKIAQKNIFIRVDFYEIEGKVYFGECTFFPNSGFEIFNPSKYDNILGDWIDLKGEHSDKN